MLGQWALERGCGDRRVPTKDKEPSVGFCLLGSDQLQLPHWQELGGGGHIPSARGAEGTPWTAPGPLGSTEFKCTFLTCKTTSKNLPSAWQRESLKKNGPGQGMGRRTHIASSQ